MTEKFAILPKRVWNIKGTKKYRWIWLCWYWDSNVGKDHPLYREMHLGYQRVIRSYTNTW